MEAAAGVGIMAEVRRVIQTLGERAQHALAARSQQALWRAIEPNLAQVVDDLAAIGPDGFPESVAEALFEASSVRGVHLGKILPRIAGASLVTARFGRRMTAANRSRAYVAKALYEAQQDLIDDVLDSGAYTDAEARTMYELATASLVAPTFNSAEYERRVRALLNADHRALAPLLARLASELNARLGSAPSRTAVFPELLRASERLGVAQSATILLRHPTLDLAAARSVGSSLWSPIPEAPWFERLAAHASWVRCHTLIDLCFLDEPPTSRDLAVHRAVWYDLNVDMSYIDHVAGIGKDLCDGIHNFAWAAIREARGALEDGPAAVTRAEEERVVAQAAAHAARAVERDEGYTGGSDGFYPFLAVLASVVLTARGVGNESWALDAFLAAFGPTYHSATYSQQGSPRRTHRGFVTRPWNPRDLRIPS